MNKTEYRTVGDGYCRWLEYREIFMFLWIIPIRFWLKVESDNYDEWIHEGLSAPDHNLYVNSYNFNLHDFVKKYPDINQWFLHRDKEIGRKKKAIEAAKSNRLSFNSGINYLS